MKGNKSVREMTPRQQKRHSLSGRVRRIVWTSALLMGLVTIVFAWEFIKISMQQLTALDITKITEEQAQMLFHYAMHLLLGYLAYLVIFIVIMNIVLNLRLQRMVAVPIQRITKAARAFAYDRKNGIAAADHFADIQIRRGNEIEELVLTMDDMEHDLAEYEANLTRVTAEKERISTELELARRIQGDMLPSTFPAFPERREFDIHASMTPAKEVGGDFYDFYLMDEDHLALVIADVSGKGIPAALFMMMAKIIMENKGQESLSPAEILAHTNEVICANNREEMFVTVWMGILEISSGRILCANAGHEKPVILHGDGTAEMIRDPHGFVIGGMEGMQYKEYELQLAPGEAIFVYTDGVPEATAASEELFGPDHMLQALQNHPEAEPAQVLQNVRRSVDEFVGAEEQFDDLTMLCLKYLGPDEAAAVNAGASDTEK